MIVLLCVLYSIWLVFFLLLLLLPCKASCIRFWLSAARLLWAQPPTRTQSSNPLFPEFPFSRLAKCIRRPKQRQASPRAPRPQFSRSEMWIHEWRTTSEDQRWSTAVADERRQGLSEDRRRALPFIKRTRAQKRTVRELSVGWDHTHKQSKLTRSRYSTCHSTNTNRSIWGGSRSWFQTHIPAPASSSTDVKSAYLTHISHSDRGNADLRSRREANVPRQQSVRCQNLPFGFLPPYCGEDKRRQKALALQFVSF